MPCNRNHLFSPAPRFQCRPVDGFAPSASREQASKLPPARVARLKVRQVHHSAHRAPRVQHSTGCAVRGAVPTADAWRLGGPAQRLHASAGGAAEDECVEHRAQHGGQHEYGASRKDAWPGRTGRRNYEHLRHRAIRQCGNCCCCPDIATMSGCGLLLLLLIRTAPRAPSTERAQGRLGTRGAFCV